MTLAGLAIASTAASTVSSVAGGLSAAKQQKKIEAFNLQANLFNAEQRREQEETRFTLKRGEIARNKIITAANYKFARHESSLATMEANYQRQQIGVNITILKQNAKVAELNAIEDARRFREAGSRFSGQQQARIAGAGVDLSSGSAIEIAVDTAEALALEAADRHHAANLARGDLLYQAEVLKVQSNNIGKVAAFQHQVGTARANLDRIGSLHSLSLQSVTNESQWRSAQRQYEFDVSASNSTPSRVPSMNAQTFAGLASGVAGVASQAYGFKNSSSTSSILP